MIFTDSSTPSIKYFNSSIRCTSMLPLHVILFEITRLILILCEIKYLSHCNLQMLFILCN